MNLSKSMILIEMYINFLVVKRTEMNIENCVKNSKGKEGRR